VGVERLQLLVVRGSQEGKRSDKGARTDAGDQFELRPVAGRSPAAEKPGPESPIVAAARQGEERGRRQGPLISPSRQIISLPFPGLHELLSQGGFIARVTHSITDVGWHA